MNNKLIQILGLIVVVGIIAFVLMHGRAPATTTNTQSTTVTYSCDTGKGVVAVFSEGPTKPATSAGGPPTPGGSVALTFSDGTKVTLAQTISADGGRYANPDESLVFWGKGNGALVLENGQQKSYTGCIALAPDQPGVSLPSFYSNSSAGISIRLPQGYTPDETYKYQQLGPGKDIVGVKFTIPAALASGTNLSSDTYVSVEEIPKTSNCSASAFLDKGVKVSTITDGGTTYSVASTTGAGAGNRYEETVYAVPGTNPCVAVRYFIHYGVLENYPAGTVQGFDEQALLGQFDSIRRALVIVQ